MLVDQLALASCAGSYLPSSGDPALGAVLRQLQVVHGRDQAVAAIGEGQSTHRNVALEDVRFAREHAKDVGRIAIISNEDLVAWLALLTSLFIEADVKVFDSEDLARKWLGESAS